MKLIYLSTARLPDGWAHGLQIMNMCEAFADNGAEVELVAPNRSATMHDDPFAYYGVRKNFTLTKLPCIDLFAGTQSSFFYFLRNFSFLLAAKVYLFFTQYDALYTREYSFAPYLPRKKSVLELHSISESNRFVQNVRKAGRIVTITNGIKDDLLKQGVQSPIVVAADAVDLAAFANPESQEAARKRLGLPIDKKIALYIGRLDSWKGIEALFEAASLLPQVLVAVIGGEPEEVAPLAKQYPQVHFLGSRPFTELANNQAAADVLVLPNTAKNAMSARYTSPLKLFTYMASGKPIVASDLPSIREILDESTAVLVKPDSPEALAEGITKVLTDAALAASLAQAARIKVEHYTWNMRAKNILSILL